MADYEAKAWFQQALYDTSRFQVPWLTTPHGASFVVSGELKNHFVYRDIYKQKWWEQKLQCYGDKKSGDFLDLLLILIIFVQVEVVIFTAYPPPKLKMMGSSRRFLRHFFLNQMKLLFAKWKRMAVEKGILPTCWGNLRDMFVWLIVSIILNLQKYVYFYAGDVCQHSSRKEKRNWCWSASRETWCHHPKMYTVISVIIWILQGC